MLIKANLYLMLIKIAELILNKMLNYVTKNIKIINKQQFLRLSCFIIDVDSFRVGEYIHA